MFLFIYSAKSLLSGNQLFQPTQTKNYVLRKNCLLQARHTTVITPV